MESRRETRLSCRRAALTFNGQGFANFNLRRWPASGRAAIRWSTPDRSLAPGGEHQRHDRRLPGNAGDLKQRSCARRPLKRAHPVALGVGRERKLEQSGQLDGRRPQLDRRGGHDPCPDQRPLTVTLDIPLTLGTLTLGNSNSSSVGYTLSGSVRQYLDAQQFWLRRDNLGYQRQSRDKCRGGLSGQPRGERERNACLRSARDHE